MFDKYLILEDSVRSDPEGFSFGIRLGYYRGLGLSMVEDLAVTVDGDKIEAAAIHFDEGKGAISLADMETAYDRRWEFGAVATLKVIKPGGLSPGAHKLELTERLRISYLPFPLVASDAKVVEIA
jgi:hypothetical protein